MKKVLGLVVLGIGAFFLWTQLGGNVTADQPTQKPVLPNVDVNEAAKGAKDGAGAAADQVQSWTPETWKIIMALVVAGGLAWLWFNKPAFKWAVIGGGIMVLAVMILV